MPHPISFRLDDTDTYRSWQHIAQTHHVPLSRLIAGVFADFAERYPEAEAHDLAVAIAERESAKRRNAALVRAAQRAERRTPTED